MAEPNSSHSSVGLVTPVVQQFDEPLLLACGRTLKQYELVYETYGELNESASNAILICHALSGDHHAAGFHSEDDKRAGWWDHYIGPGKPIDTNLFYVVSINNLGGCSGSSGPTSINPETSEPFGSDFPQLRVRDWVNSQAKLGDKLGIQQWAAVIGGSLGGMQVMRWALEYPDRVRHAVIIASAMKLTAQNIAFNNLARQAIQSDPQFCKGHYLKNNTKPRDGLALARMIGHVTYLSDDSMGDKFGRELRTGSFQQGQEDGVEFQVESYLHHQGHAFSEDFDANTYILMTRALDYFDLAREYNNDPIEAFKNAKAKFLVVSFTTDWRFAPERSREIVDGLITAGKDVSYAEIDASYGHDAFLIPISRYEKILGSYLLGVHNSLAANPSNKEESV